MPSLHLLSAFSIVAMTTTGLFIEYGKLRLETEIVVNFITHVLCMCSSYYIIHIYKVKSADKAFATWHSQNSV